ncbi:MAG: hypothetical protein ABI378_01270 [Chitinophagaceae bacterium]
MKREVVKKVSLGILVFVCMLCAVSCHLHEQDFTTRTTRDDLENATAKGDAPVGGLILEVPKESHSILVTGGRISGAPKSSIFIFSNLSASRVLACSYQCPPNCKLNRLLDGPNLGDMSRAIIANQQCATITSQSGQDAIAKMTGPKDEFTITDAAINWLQQHKAIYMEICHARTKNDEKYLLIGGFDGSFKNVLGSKYYRLDLPTKYK